MATDLIYCSEIFPLPGVEPAPHPVERVQSIMPQTAMRHFEQFLYMKENPEANIWVQERCE